MTTRTLTRPPVRETPCEPILPAWLQPMLAQSAPPSGLTNRACAYEVKWDGMRVLAGLQGDRLCFRTRNSIDATQRFPELAALREVAERRDLVLDGEIVRMVEGRPSFWALTHRIQASHPREIARLAEEEPTQLIVFDLLREDGEWLLDLPWSERRQRLEQALTPDPTVLISPVWDDGEAVWEAVCAQGLEGIIAKRRTARYYSGKRTDAWLKMKTTETLDLVVGGWTEGLGGRNGFLGALLVGAYDKNGLAYLGHVGTGFNTETLREAKALLAPLESKECPLQSCPKPNAKPHWIRPEVVCEVRFQGWSADRRLRAPVFVRWRPDKRPEECVAGLANTL